MKNLGPYYLEPFGEVRVSFIYFSARQIQLGKGKMHKHCVVLGLLAHLFNKMCFKLYISFQTAFGSTETLRVQVRTS